MSFTLQILAKECLALCKQGRCPMRKFTSKKCDHINEEQWVYALAHDDALLKYIDETVGKQLEIKYARN